MLKNFRGITLIALVVTIVILLILSGIAIATLTGDNGILTRASDAAEKTREAEEEELRKITALEASTNLENKEYTDSNGETAIIPAGFAVSQVEGENTVEDGLVIIDRNGNEFVWVPINNYDDFRRRQGYANGNLQDITNYGEADENGINIYRDETSTTKKEAQNMYASVKKNKGFYIGRFETGLENNTEVIRKNVNPYTNIAWSASGTATETNESTGGAIEIARNFDNLYEYKMSQPRYVTAYNGMLQFPL